MITKSYIEDTLKKLDLLYSKTKSAKKTEYYAKLAVIEVCGWIEESFDDIVLWYANSKLKESGNIKEYTSIVKRNSAFDYDDNIRPLLFKIIGFVNLEKIETRMNKKGDIDKLRAYLDSFKGNRNSAAHTHVKNVTHRFDAPSKVYTDWLMLYKILKDIEREIREIK